MTHKLITTENYLLVVDDSEININQYVYCDLGYIEKVMDIINGWVYHTKMLGKNPIKHYKKIIAHLPLNPPFIYGYTNSPILEGVDLLPPLEDEAEKLAKEYANGTSDIDVPYTNGLFYGFLEGYNKAKAKYKYTEEDVIKIVEKSRETGLTAEYLMLSLQQPKMPVGFKYTDKIYKVKSGTIQEHKDSLAGYEYYEWVGRYIY
jgi:hypothetical protein